MQEPLSGLHIADVGCGGGILTFPLARLGANVTAIDASSDVIKSVGEMADRFRTENPLFGKTTFECASVEDFAARNPRSKVHRLIYDVLFSFLSMLL